jgi:hypothetical protein
VHLNRDLVPTQVGHTQVGHSPGTALSQIAVDHGSGWLSAPRET